MQFLEYVSGTLTKKPDWKVKSLDCYRIFKGRAANYLAYLKPFTGDHQVPFKF